MTNHRQLFEQAGLTVFERGWLSANNVLFAGGSHHESVLVDTGYGTHAEQTVALVRHALGKAPLQRIVNTHLHSDHCGGNHALQSVYGCAIDVPVGEAPFVDAWDEAALSYRATGQFCPRFIRSGVVGGSAQTVLVGTPWQVLPAGGHDPSSIMLYQPELELLISADALWENGFGVIFPELEGEAGFDEARATLERIASLKIACVIPGHGRPFAGVTGALDVAFRRLEAFVADPVRHARHAAKVLIKFHLLAQNGELAEKVLAWSVRTPYFHRTHLRHFSNQPFETWINGLMADLCRSGAARLTDGWLFND